MKKNVRIIFSEKKGLRRVEVVFNPSLQTAVSVCVLVCVSSLWFPYLLSVLPSPIL